MIRDYAEIPKNGLLNIFRFIAQHTDRKLMLIGDYWLCLKLQHTLKIKFADILGRIGYCDVLNKYKDAKKELLYVNPQWICENDICLLLLSGYIGCFDDTDNHSYRETVKKQYLERIQKDNIGMIHIIDYSLETPVFMENMESEYNPADLSVKVRGIVLGAINYYSGNTLFRGILDNHPNIIMLDYGYINHNIYYLCIRLAMEKGKHILELFWKLYSEENLYCGGGNFNEDKVKKFNQNMEKMLSEKEIFTSQELFIIIHAAYAAAWSKYTINFSDTVIYWEAHFISRDMHERFALWLGDICVSKNIVNIVRNSYICRGSGLRIINDRGWGAYNMLWALKVTVQYQEIRNKVYADWKRTIIRFEDLKCDPQKQLKFLCDELEIEWSDTLLETTMHGQKVYMNNITGFELAPVYRIYEEYYSEFDRFRITLLTGPWQEQYGYPFVSSLNFSRKELRELFLKDFRFEERMDGSDIEKRNIKKPYKV